MFELFGNWIAYSVLSLERGSQLGDAVQFFAMDITKIFILLTVIVYLFGYLRPFLNGHKIRRYLSGRRKEPARILAILLGAISPFCSCSSVPLFIGFVEARISLGIAFAFLISSPLINEVAVVLLISTLGWQITLLYLGLGITIAYLVSYLIERFKPEQWVEPYVWDIALPETHEPSNLSIGDRHTFAIAEVYKIVSRVWLWLIVGIAVGASFHGYIPSQWVTTINEQYAILSVPLAVLVGIPLYSDIAATIPFAEAMLIKGATLGTVMALIMSISAISLPEFLILRKIITWKGLLSFAAMLAVSFTLIGWLLNAI